MLAKDEAVAHFSVVNKIREQLLIGMKGDIERGNDGKRFIEALRAIQDEMNSFQKNLPDILK